MRERSFWVTHWVESSVDCLLCGKVPVVQLRRRDSSTKAVVIEERRYDCAEEGGEGAPAQLGGGEPLSSLDETAAAFGGASFGGSVDDDGMYAWAQRLRDIPDKDALNELAMMGYTTNDMLAMGRGKYAFANGTGTGKRGKRRNGGKANAKRR